jgi:transcriptional antiterminator NusG
MSDQVNAGVDAAASGMRWYVVHAYSGMEKAVERNIVERVANAGMQGQIRPHSGAYRRGG